jgi:hypothetical protein
VSVMDAMKNFEFSGIPQGIERFVLRGHESRAPLMLSSITTTRSGAS